MESSEELQQLELTALKSIYAEDFIETPPPKAWKGAPRLHEFTIRVPHPDAAHASEICFNLHVIFPKTYPTKATPTFTIQKPILGISNDQVATLLQALQNEVKNCRGAEMIFQIVTFCQDWLTSHVVPTITIPGSLANQMTLRALEEERIRKRKEADAADQETERAAKLAQELAAAVKADAQRQQLAKELQYEARKRASSEATEVAVGADSPTESFSEAIIVDGVQFTAVRIFHRHPERLGTSYTADPICDDVNTSLPLRLYVVTFASHYYITSQGKKKLKQVEAETRRLIAICHPNVLRIYAVKLTFPHTGSPRLVVLHEAPPGMTLRDVLEDCDSIKEERALEYLVQILSGLNTIHAADIVHRGMAADCIGITSDSKTKTVKLMKVAFYTRLLDLHRSNPFGPNISVELDESRIPDQWLSKDVKNESSLLYTRHRDIHAVGIVLMQMFLGLDVTERYPDAYSAMRASNMSSNLQQHALNMLFPSKKNHLSCLSLLADLASAPLSTAVAPQSPMVSTYDLKTPMPGNQGSPEIEFNFHAPLRNRHTSRWKEDWEELEMLGKGAFGSVVKARNKIDSRIYAVKKIRLSTTHSDTKIFREVNALSRLSHRFIVRYFTTWVETAEASSTTVSDDSGAESGTDGMTSVPDTSEQERRILSSDLVAFDLADLDDMGSGSRSSFPSIHFSRSSSPRTDDGDVDEDESSSGSNADVAFVEFSSAQTTLPMTPTFLSRTLYIQMEFVERQTLQETIEEGLSEQEAWRLFQQILEALVYMSSLGILHRDIKLTNIFIDAKGDCKVGDFGLATSNPSALEPIPPSHVPHTSDPELTLEVGTRLYIAPEVQSRKRGPRNHAKADMYSLGIVFFEMNHKFMTGAERIAVIEDLRQPLVIFPSTWGSHLTRQKQIITRLLDHDPDTRPTALELSQSPMLPARLEDEYFKGALGMMVKPDSPHYQAVLSSLFSQSQPPARRFLYDVEVDLPEHAALNDIVNERLSYIFRLHGAVDMEPPLFMPVVKPAEGKNKAAFIDRYGEIVALPSNLLLPFARLAAKGNISRIKRYHIANVYRESDVAGHPKFQKAALFDIISTDMTSGLLAASAEIIAVANDCLDSFPNLNENYEIHISHSSILHVVFERIPSDLRPSVQEILGHSKASASQKRALLLKKGLLRSMADELEILADTDEDIDGLLTRLEKVSPSLASLLRPVVEVVKETIQYAVITGVARPILFHPLMLGNHHAHFNDGVLVEVVRKNKMIDVLAAGGRYDRLVAEQATPGQKLESVCAVGLQIAVEKITMALAAYQVSSVRALVKQERSFGFWSPRRCDVYVVSYQPGYLQDRLEVVSFLWQHNISADLMYESSIPDVEHEDICSREGVLFSVYPRPRTGRRDQLAFKVKSVLKGTEYELTRQELIGWLQQQIAEQKKIDASTSGALRFTDVGTAVPSKDVAGASGVQLLLPVDIKKQRKQVKQLFMDRAFETGREIEATVQAGMPILAVDVLPAVFDIMIKSAAWLTDEEVWKALAAVFPVQQLAYAQQVREAAVKRKTEGHPYILLFAVREERVQLLKLT
ncbi:kinase-like domain-containing protein [Mycena pura]|uniref:non-specific serine/threonine protein kinase n=1 Tax=Mycena pura TaxID=153505 RepID=A0AAD6VTW0_9AGAR|nr:kinase-like domain-containing protein [Mycena pura]